MKNEERKTQKQGSLRRRRWRAMTGNRRSCACETIKPSRNRRGRTHLVGTPMQVGDRILPQVSSALGIADILGDLRVRWGWGRMQYAIPPGLYALGQPDRNSPVLVSANYKMSFDCLRKALKGLHAWILVLDTHGINVWCAAGKGTFGTEELVKRIRQEHLADVVDHRTVIVPQLGASGVAGHTVRTQSGFRVQFGPIRAQDLPLYFAQAGEASLAMRQVRFGLRERLALVPVELVGAAPWTFLAGVVLFLLDLVIAPNIGFLAHLRNALWGFIPYLGAIVIGTVLVPILLPWIPGRAFALKGWFLGLVWVAIDLMVIAPGSSWKQILFLSLILPPISAFLALSFTGSSTFTSLSGVRKEMRLAIPVIFLSVTLSLLFLVITYFVSW